MNLAETNFGTRALDFVVPIGPFLRRVKGKPLFSGWKDLVFHVLPLTFFVYWLFSFVPFVGGVLYLLVLMPLSARRHIALSGSTATTLIYLWYLTVAAIGFMGLWGFIGHVFMADRVAEGIGWATGSPFQTELAFYSLGTGVAGILAVWLRGHMVTGLVITKVIFWYGAAYTHLLDAALNHNFSLLNIGTPLVNDILLPTVLLVLLYKSLKIEK